MIIQGSFGIGSTLSKGRHNPIPTLLDDDIPVVGDRAKADIFNHYFHSVFTREDMSSSDTLKDSTDFHYPIIKYGST